MRTIQSNIPLALGDLINLKTYLDDVKSECGQICLTFHRSLYDSNVNSGKPDWSQKRVLWEKYLSEIGSLFFSEPPYILDSGQYTFRDTNVMIKDFGLRPRKPELSHLLCKGTPLNIDGEYIVITTKAREMMRRTFLPLSIQLWSVLRKLAQKYKIVILGEREVEMRKEYGVYPDAVFSVYEQIILNIPNDAIIDLTVPALGETVTNLAHIQQDCLIMNQAKFVITLGIGGNFVMSTATAKMTVGFRTDHHWLADHVFGVEQPSAIVTKDWPRFIRALEGYL